MVDPEPVPHKTHSEWVTSPLQGTMHTLIQWGNFRVNPCWHVFGNRETGKTPENPEETHPEMGRKCETPHTYLSSGLNRGLRTIRKLCGSLQYVIKQFNKL